MSYFWPSCKTFVKTIQKFTFNITYFFPSVAPKLDLSRVRDTIVVKAGTTFHIDIPFKATPLPSVDWSKDGTHLESTTRVKIETTEFGTVLTAKNCVKADEGVYSVRVRNAGGEATAKIRVVVEDKPYPPEGPIEVLDVGTTDATIRWRSPLNTGGSDITHYCVEKRDMKRTSWTRISARVPSTTFKVTDLSEGSEVQFRVIAVNKVGESEPLEGDIITLGVKVSK